MRSRSAVENTLRQSGLPADALDVIRRLVRQSRLWRAERQDVLDEMVAHFQDGIEAGLSISDLLADFGDPDETARLIRSAKRRQRPLAWRAAFVSLRVSAIVVATVATVYGSRAATLYLRAPVSGVEYSAAAVAPIAERTGDAWMVEGQDVLHRVTTSWSEEARAQAALLNQDPGAFVDAVTSLFALSAQHRREASVAGDLAAAQIEASTAQLIADARLDFDERQSSALASLLNRPASLDGVRSAFSVLLDDMYTTDVEGDGQLTGTGIELVRQLKQWHRPTMKDRVLEPMWYFFPASRSEVWERFEAAVCAAEHCGPGPKATELLEPIARSVHECLRFPALSAVLPQLARVLLANEAAIYARQSALSTLDS